MIAIKDRSVLHSVLTAQFHPTLIELLMWVDELYPGKLVITSGYRAEDPGVHGTMPCRAIDIRSWTFTHPQKIADGVNINWEYDSERPDMRCCIFHNVGYGGHFHLQVHRNTIRR